VGDRGDLSIVNHDLNSNWSMIDDDHHDHEGWFVLDGSSFREREKLVQREIERERERELERDEILTVSKEKQKQRLSE